jgi:hypothetical protein
MLCFFSRLFGFPETRGAPRSCFFSLENRFTFSLTLTVSIPVSLVALVYNNSRVKLVPLDDNFGPPGKLGSAHLFDALVLSHETLQTGFELNQHRQQVLGLPPLQLLCTRRTEAHGMSSTTLRRLRHSQARTTSTTTATTTSSEKQQEEPE